PSFIEMLRVHFPRWVSVAAMLVMAVGLAWTAFRPAAPAEEGDAPFALEVGNEFPEIALRNPFGELVPLSSLKPNVVLVEFWASYSKVCTEEHCWYFLPLYEQYKDKGFEIYGVSVDTSAQHWLTGIERDDLPWIQVADIGEKESELWKQFEITELPTTFLLDEKGNIIAKNIGRDELEKHLETLLAGR
ncbi:MAG: TlpA disulfide reductase family protein, partial [Bacteroidota bacterium]